VGCADPNPRRGLVHQGAHQRARAAGHGKAKRADYILYYKPNRPIAIVEAKDNNYAVGQGMQQALEIRANAQLPSACVVPGSGRTAQGVDLLDIIPIIPNLADYDNHRLTLPIQTERGCSYGQCQFCTYPVIEGRLRSLPARPLEFVAAYAQEEHADIAVKDSLASAEKLEAIGATVRTGETVPYGAKP
jgi:hypothetical protein